MARPSRLLACLIPAIGAHTLAAGAALAVWNWPAVGANMARGICVTLLIGQLAVLSLFLIQWAVGRGMRRRLCAALLGNLACYCLAVFYVFQFFPITRTPRAVGEVSGFVALWWSLIPLAGGVVTSAGLRVLRIRIGHPDAGLRLLEQAAPRVPLRRLFAVTAAFALVLGLARGIPEHFAKLGSLGLMLTLASSVALSAVGLVTMIMSPIWAALSNYEAAVRWAAFVTIIVSFGTLIPLCFNLPWQVTLGILGAVSFVQILMYFTLLPCRLMGYRLLCSSPPG